MLPLVLAAGRLPDDPAGWRVFLSMLSVCALFIGIAALANFQATGRFRLVEEDWEREAGVLKFLVVFLGGGAAILFGGFWLAERLGVPYPGPAGEIIGGAIFGAAFTAPFGLYHAWLARRRINDRATSARAV